MLVTGLFEVKLDPQNDELTPAGRMTISKEYLGGLTGKGIGQMLSKRTDGESVYSAIEEFEGALEGKKGAFTLFHNGIMSSLKHELTIVVVAGSGTGELAGIQGTMSITQEGGNHQYEFTYTL